MGNYNPRVPQNLGEEWVPIREEDIIFSPSVNSFEQGHGFTLTSSKVLTTGRFYLNTFPPAVVANRVMSVSIYSAGTEDDTGPIREVIIPCNSAAVTGSGISLINTLSATDALSSPSDGRYIQIIAGSVGANDITMFFATNSYAPQLNGKRILDVRLAYVAGINLTGSTSPLAGQIRITNDASIGPNYGFLEGFAPEVPTSQITYADLGEVSPLFNSVTYVATPERVPWTYADLQKLEASASGRIMGRFSWSNQTAFGGAYVILYAALVVTFCEEKRLAVGMKSFGSNPFPTLGTDEVFALGANTVTMRTLAGASLPVLTLGDYTTLLSAPNVGDTSLAISSVVSSSAYPLLNGLREYYAIPPHPGLLNNIPSPVSSHVGDTFTAETTHVLPQISLHTSGGPITEVHAYGRQAVAQVYGTITATQEILDSAALFARSWPQVRFYARRFGNTTVPLLLDSPTITGSGLSVQISPPAFDELPEIVDGWKEVTLRFSTAPTMGAGTTPQWRWSANGENSGDRWEVLGCMAPALSGVPGNLMNRVPSPNQLSLATYGAPSAGDTVNFGWVPQYAPAVTATSDDQTSDGVLIFAQDMPTVTGFSVSMLTQPVSGIGPDCGIDPCCIPTGIRYNSLTWSTPTNTGRALDDFDRTVAAGSWGSASDVGGAYTLETSPADHSVGLPSPPWDTLGKKGLITFTGTGSRRFAVLSIGAVNFDISVDVVFLTTPDGGSGLLRGGAAGRYTDGANNYIASVDVSPTGTVQLRLEKRVLGVVSTLVTISRPDLAGGVGSTLRVRLLGSGTILKAKVWDPLLDEPTMWDIETTDSDLTTGSLAGIFGRTDGTTATQTVGFGNLLITPPSFWFGYYELQRMDDLTDWETIMKSTSTFTVGFLDYEARVGLVSSYRIRAVDELGFAGPWSATVTSTVTEPGVDIDCTGGHLLMFTSNSEQDGSVNLAYSSVWEGSATVSEDFEFLEAGDVSLQKMYNKNFVTAFRPLERGGERFTRTVLVQAAAISPPTLGDFTALRDMAWDTVPYICVRDEDGNRWFATVVVPSGRVQLNRTIYMAPVTVIEVTDAPFPVDP